MKKTLNLRIKLWNSQTKHLIIFQIAHFKRSVIFNSQMKCFIHKLNSFLCKWNVLFNSRIKLFNLWKNSFNLQNKTIEFTNKTFDYSNKNHRCAALHPSLNIFKRALFSNHKAIHMLLTVAFPECYHQVLPNWIYFNPHPLYFTPVYDTLIRATSLHSVGNIHIFFFFFFFFFDTSPWSPY